MNTSNPVPSCNGHLLTLPTVLPRVHCLNANRYVDEILRKYEVEKGPGTAVYEAGEFLRGLIQRWYSTRLVRVHNSGSFAKGTSIKGGTDLDLFISLKPRSGKSLKSMFEGLHQLVQSEGLGPRRQNVSIGVEVNGVKVDLVPARKHTGKSDHSLYLNRQKGWTRTNVDAHISLVRRSGKNATIRAAKIWRTNRGLRFPSFYLEIAVLRALQNRGAGGTADELERVLKFLAGNFCQAQIVDPANKANIISLDLSSEEKQQVANQARASLRRVQEGQWERVVW